MTTVQVVTQYLQAIVLVVAAVYNGILTFEAYEKGHRWKTIFSVLTVALLLVVAWDRLWPIF